MAMPGELEDQQGGLCGWSGVSKGEREEGRVGGDKARCAELCGLF